MEIHHAFKMQLKKWNRIIKFHLFETDDVFIYWPDFNKGILLLLFYLCIIPAHGFWYVLNYNSENHIWFSESYYNLRLFTTGVQYILGLLILIISLKFQQYKKIRIFMGWFIPLFFGLSLIFSAQSCGLYSPAAIGRILTILLIGFVFYKPKVIYSIMLIVTIYFLTMCIMTAKGVIPYAPLFSQQLNQSDLYKNTFWLKSMVILYVPILVVSALFFEILLLQWRRREKKIETLSHMDGLTNVYNRRYTTDFIDKLQKKNNLNYAVIILDLDFFKKINDDYGHEAGDEVLRSISHELKMVVRQQDIVGRLGGEEFIVVLPECDLTQAINIAERCRYHIQSLDIMLKNKEYMHVTASFGVAVSKLHQSMDDVFVLADKALYLSKEKGRNCVSHYLELII